MPRKKWTPKEDITPELIKAREKRKWQQALRRYVLERNLSENYAVYFGLSIEKFREWIELQFTEGLNWVNFAEIWQFEHVIPIGYFDFNLEEDLKLAWSFINIRVEELNLNKVRNRKIEVIAAKAYFERLYEKTNYSICAKMLDKIKKIEEANMVYEPNVDRFLIDEKMEIEQMASLNSNEFAQLNKGKALSDILLEQEILRKFG